MPFALRIDACLNVVETHKTPSGNEHIVKVAIADDDRIALFALDIHRDGSEFIVGRRETGKYFSVPEDTIRILSLLDGQSTLRLVRQQLAAEYETSDQVLDEFLETLLNAGFVCSISGRQVEPRDGPEPRRSAGAPRRVGWLFSRPMAALYTLMILAGAAVVCFDPHSLPRPSEVLTAVPYWFLASFAVLIAVANIAKHEAAHILAATYMGVHAECTLGHRWFFPVIQTNLTGLWAVDRRKRYLAYSAGIVSDLLVAAILVVACWLKARGIVVCDEAYMVVPATALLVVGMGIVWQFNFFLKTDIYYMLANALGCRNLHGDSVDYLWYLARRLVGSRGGIPLAGIPRREVPAIRVYSAVVFAGTLLLTVVGGLYVYRVAVLVLGSSEHFVPLLGNYHLGMGDKIAGLTLLATNIGLVACSIRKNRRLSKVTYRLTVGARP